MGDEKRCGSDTAEPNPPRTGQRWAVSHNLALSVDRSSQAVERVTIESEVWRPRAVPGSRDEPMNIDQVLATAAATPGLEVRVHLIASEAAVA